MFPKWLAELWESDFSLCLMTLQQSTSAQKPGEWLFYELLCLPSLRLTNELQHTADHSVRDIYVPKHALVA